MDENLYICPVCGYDGLGEPPYNGDLSYPSYEICSCCGFEYGFDDQDQGYSFKEYRDKWIKEGMEWFNPGKKPDNWDYKKQFSNIERDILIAHANIIQMVKQYRDLTISLEELSKVIDVNSFAPPDYSDSVIICKEHVISILEKYKQNEASELDLARWAKFIMFSEWYDYCEEGYETITSVVADLEAPLLWGNYVDRDSEELNEFMGKLSPEKADVYINALRNNTEI